MALDLAHFDPDAIGVKTFNLFGLPTKPDNADVIIIPVPWEATVSYKGGTMNGPSLIKEASFQIDLFDLDHATTWQAGYYMPDIPEEWIANSQLCKAHVQDIIAALENGEEVAHNQVIQSKIALVNDYSRQLNDWVYAQARYWMSLGKKVGLVGGEHSVPYGFIKALGEHYGSIGILQIDAHADLREAYEGFQFSHASIMYNVIHDIPQVSHLVQVGIRDFGQAEFDLAQHHPKITTFYDRTLKESQYAGETWQAQCDRIIDALPDLVYISFDIDGLDPKLCPGTGTPVPGGFELEQVFYLLKRLQEKGKKMIGFDLNEVSSGAEWVADGIDAITGARALYKLCACLASQSI